jgi:hypothetical protein
MRLTQMPSQNAIVPTALISQKIFFVRGTRIMLDAESRPPVCSSYKKPEQSSQTKRQPLSCRFHVSTHPKELQSLGFQSGTSKRGRGGRRYAPYAFTEQGVAMLSSVLRSSRAVHVNVAIMRTFVRLREMLATHEELRRKIDAMEKRYDARFQAVFETIRRMLETPIPEKKPIGFHTRLDLPAKSAHPSKASLNNTK